MKCAIAAQSKEKSHYFFITLILQVPLMKISRDCAKMKVVLHIFIVLFIEYRERKMRIDRLKNHDVMKCVYFVSYRLLILIRMTRNLS